MKKKSFNFVEPEELYPDCPYEASRQKVLAWWRDRLTHEDGWGKEIDLDKTPYWKALEEVTAQAVSRARQDVARGDFLPISHFEGFILFFVSNGVQDVGMTLENEEECDFPPTIWEHDEKFEIHFFENKFFPLDNTWFEGNEAGDMESDYLAFPYRSWILNGKLIDGYIYAGLKNHRQQILSQLKALKPSKLPFLAAYSLLGINVAGLLITIIFGSPILMPLLLGLIVQLAIYIFAVPYWIERNRQKRLDHDTYYRDTIGLYSNRPRRSKRLLHFVKIAEQRGIRFPENLLYLLEEEAREETMRDKEYRDEVIEASRKEYRKWWEANEKGREKSDENKETFFDHPF